MFQTRNVFADDVKLQVYLRAYFDIVEVGVVVGVGNDADLKTIVSGVANGKAHTIDGHATFVHAEIATLCHFAVGFVGKCEAVTAFFARFSYANRCLVYVSLYDVPIQTTVHHHGAFYVDLCANDPIAKVGAFERFAHGGDNVRAFVAAYDR